jgi:hypothetical protein
MSHQQNHLAKRRKNIFDQSIAKLLAEIDLAKNTLHTAVTALEMGGDPQILLKHLKGRLEILEDMKQFRG